MVDLPASGLRSWNASTGYENVYAYRPSTISAGPDGYLLDYGPSGLWSYQVGGVPGSPSFRKVDVSPPEGTAVGAGVGYLDYGPGGLWRWSPSWDPAMDSVTRLSTADPGRIVATNYGLVAEFGAAGLWFWDSPGSIFTKINNLIPDVMAVDPDARDAYFGFATGGLWRWWGAGWLKINDATPQAVARM